MARLVHSTSWMTEHPNDREHSYRYACGAAFLCAPGTLRTEHSDNPARVTCEACKHAVQERAKAEGFR